MTTTPTLLKGSIPNYLGSESLEIEFYIKNIDKAAIKAIIEKERAQGTLICSNLISRKMNEYGVYTDYSDANATCGDFGKCVMGALLCAAGYTPLEVDGVVADVSGWNMKEYRAMWHKFGLVPHQCIKLMRVNDNTGDVDERAGRLITTVNYDFLPEPISPRFFDMETYPDNVYGTDFANHANGLPYVSIDHKDILRNIGIAAGQLTSETV